MIKKTITYSDYNGKEHTEDFYFNLSKAELMEKEMGVQGGFVEMLNRIIKAEDAPSIIKEFKILILEAYGEKSVDGKRFIKIAPDGHRLADDFAQTEAYSNLFMELGTNSDAASEFVNGIIN